MPVDFRPSDIPVLLVYNMDPAWSAPERSEVRAASEELGDALAEAGHPIVPLEIGHGNIAGYLEVYHPLEQIVFNWCEGLPGLNHSEWMAARAMEELGFVFTGASAETLAVTQNKYHTKMILESRGVPTPGWRISGSPEDSKWDRFPAIVKPVNEHCSEGISREAVVDSPGELAARIDYILQAYNQPVMVEDFIDGREFHVSLWGNGRLEMLPPAEMDFSLFTDLHDRLCTYDAKFSPGSVPYENIRTLLPAPLSPDELCGIEQVCKAAYQALACRDYARIDVRSRGGIFYVLDVNPNADISSDASMACAAELAGFSYGEMGSRLVRLAAARHPVWGRS